MQLPTIHYIIRSERPSPDGSAPIYMRVSFNRKQMPLFSMNKTIPLKKEFKHLTSEEIKKVPAKRSSTDQLTRDDLYYWDKDKEKSTRGHGSMEVINLFLDDERKRANDILFGLLKQNKLSVDLFKKEFLYQNTYETFLTYSLNELSKNRSEQFSEETKKSYKAVLNKLNEYKPNVRVTDITYKLLTEYENHMLKPIKEGGRGNNARTVENNMKVIRTFIGIAVKNGDLSENQYPFATYKIKETQKFFSTRDFLEPDEILLLEKLYDNYIPPSKPIHFVSSEEWKEREAIGIITPGEHQTLRAFLIGCYTGLRFKDTTILNGKDHLCSKYITNPKNGDKVLKHYIEIDLHKTGVNVIIPLIDKVLKLIDLKEEGEVCRSISNQKTNQHLKRIQEKAKLNKVLTFHVSRHSFATTAFEYDIPEKIVQTILGHRNKKFTQIYTHLSSKKLFFEMDKMNTGYSESELLILELNHGNNDLNKPDNLKSIVMKLKRLDDAKLEKLSAFLELI